MQELFKLHIGDTIERFQLTEKLEELHYQKKDFVTKPGEFAVRGGIFDLYPVTYRTPVRLEFERNSLTSIRDFSLASGESLTSFQEVFLIPVSAAFENKLKRLAEKYQSFEPVFTPKQLEQGDYVVHMKYGIGRFLGLKALQIKGERRKHLALEYADREILYIEESEPIERYIGGEGKPPKLTKLHSKDWEKIKERTKRAIDHVAREMIELEAKRSVGKGFQFERDSAYQKEFEAAFPFDETPDQIKAIEEIKKNMESQQPMDRLLAGDVGYGKTEVAIRAAFKAVMGGRQVGILVPTTVLAEQHYVVFEERLKNFPVSVEVLSRFKSKKNQNQVVEGIKNGTVDIVIGTHRILSKDIHFKNLGLVIIDEEQRFGVRHKEKLKEFRVEVDVLTMTATPIPRTLYMSLVGVRDMSLIQTPPSHRLPIETSVLEYDEQIVKNAILKELARGGQIYFIHNRVQSIEKIYRQLALLLPHVKFGVAHGQMQPGELESVMKEFLSQRIDCLIATTILSSGIDIPNVNTIFVNRADTFGLSDLYQLRGRVGRYQISRQAYAYFLVPKNWVLTQNAQKRLSAIERFTELGSGFKIALEDLEIRGAGNLLGHEQSGFIHAVGFDLYCRMLKQTIDQMKKKN